jgi:hypothetical protein
MKVKGHRVPRARRLAGAGHKDSQRQRRRVVVVAVCMCVLISLFVPPARAPPLALVQRVRAHSPQACCVSV